MKEEVEVEGEEHEEEGKKGIKREFSHLTATAFLHVLFLSFSTNKLPLIRP